VNVPLLIDAIVRQTTVLVAELATSGGLRAPLAHVANQVFADLARELDAQGVSRKVSADMFGMALRTYQRKVQHLSESSTDRGRSLWEAIYDFVRKRNVVDRRTVLHSFRNEDEAIVRGVLHDLVDSGLVFATGPAQDTSFRAATDEELGAMADAKHRDTDELIWALIFRTGPAKLSSLSALGALDPSRLVSTIDRLLAAGRVRREAGDEADDPTYLATHFFVPIGAPSGWEAAVFDHYHAVVRTVCAKLRSNAERSAPDESLGGSTYSFEVWPGHPWEGEVLAMLSHFRARYSELRRNVREHNEQNDAPPRTRRVTIYAGQCSWEEDADASG
jgi:hypothetical protein